MMIRHFAGIDPEPLSDEKWAQVYWDVVWLLKKFYPYQFEQ
jgi:hypothetical protein